MPRLAALLLLQWVPPALSQRPNLIWLQADSVDGRLYDPTSSLYSKLLIDALRENYLSMGVNFVRHYTNSPQCVPSRTSMITSRYVHDSWTPNNGQGLARSPVTGKLDSNCLLIWGQQFCEEAAARQNVTATMIDLVKAAGYRFAPFGRFDVGAGIMDDYPNTDGDGWHDGPELGILARGAAIEGAIDSRGPLANLDSTDPNPYPADVRRSAAARAWLESDNPEGKRPFFLWCGLMVPHPPYDSNSSWLAHVNASSVDVPQQIARGATHYYDQFMSRAKHVWGEFVAYTDADITAMRKAYWGAVAEASELIREVLHTAETTGHLNNTIVFISSDHGEMSLEHRQDLKSSLRDPSARVPLVIIPFGVKGMSKKENNVVTNITSHLDVLPTLLEAAGAKPPADARGQSLLPFLLDGAASPARKDYAVSTYASNYAPCGSYMLRNAQYKLIEFGSYFPAFLNASVLTPQLFDLIADPYELQDVAAQRPTVVAELHALLESELGGPGSIQRIEAELMEDNLSRFRTVWFEKCTGEELVASFLADFAGSDRAGVIERVTQWFGTSPLAAQGAGGTCPHG
jgi:arylsulfatase A-like enzyme